MKKWSWRRWRREASVPSQDIKTAVAERIKDQAAECSRATAGRRSSETRTGPRQKEELANSARPVSDGSTFSCLRAHAFEIPAASFRQRGALCR